MKVFMLMLSVFLVSGSFIYAQTVTGVVSGALGTIPSADVLVKGTTMVTVSDFDGNYQFSVSNGDVLVFSRFGFITQEIAYSGQATINVWLEEDTTTNYQAGDYTKNPPPITRSQARKARRANKRNQPKNPVTTNDVLGIAGEVTKGLMQGLR